MLCSCASSSMNTRGEDAVDSNSRLFSSQPQAHIPMIVQVHLHEIAMTLLNKISYEFPDIIFTRGACSATTLNLPNNFAASV